ncbi:MAG: DUF1449 family protein [Candidatus Pseudobacter hemicellulosilyticus]|uniref:DUF1449 family protein n=1 Tax=Candidatus Pseudobacter hemicellulosilyticus TaxID=3121375 RepID=A0AAJ6BFU7_9BACT|nr:MAG: DUF1449 family protein [Pseudobacter sp.]
MAELARLLFHPLSNGIMTVLAGLTALYWIFTFFTGDFVGDIDGSPDLDVDADTDADVDTDNAEPSFFSKALDFVNAGKMPFMVIYSTFKFIAWIITLVTSLFFNIADWGWKSVLILIPVFLIAFWLTRFATKPLIKVYAMMGYNGEEPQELLGRVAKMRSAIQGDKLGAAELVINHDLIRINVKSRNGEAIAYNAEVMIAAESEDKRFYYVVPEINLKNIV